MKVTVSLEEALKMWASMVDLFPETTPEERKAIFSAALRQLHEERLSSTVTGHPNER